MVTMEMNIAECENNSLLPKDEDESANGTWSIKEMKLAFQIERFNNILEIFYFYRSNQFSFH